MSENKNASIDPKDAKMWATSGDAYFPCESVEKELGAGQYTIEMSNQRGLYFNKTKATLDGLVDLPDSSSDKVLSHIKDFWNKRDRYKNMNFTYKRGIILWGPPGSGKTTTVQQVSKMVVDRGGVAIYIRDPELAALGLQILRRIEPDRPIVVMMEDIEAMINNRSHDENHLLSLLDGELQIDNVIFVATTNFPEKLPPRLVNRPSRFDIVQKIGMPKNDARRVYLLAKYAQLDDMDYPVDANMERKDQISKEMDILINKINQLEGSVKEVSKATDDEIEQSEAKRKDKSLRLELKEENKKKDALIKELEGLSEKRSLLDYLIEHTDGFSIAHLKELMISILVYEQKAEYAINRLRKMMNITLTSKSDDSSNSLE